jgi:hypothetical protein
MNRGRRAFLQGGGALAATTMAPAVRAQYAAAPAAADRGLWISWYDVADEARADYLNWTHNVYLPALLQRPGYLWAAHYQTVERMQTIRRENATEHPAVAGVPRGRQFLLLVGAADANVFGQPTPREVHAALPEAGRKMLALRANERVNVMAEVGRVTGPEAKAYADGVRGTPCIQLGSFNCAVEDEEEMLAWYAQSRMPAMATLPGCVRTRKLASVAGWAKHAIFYEYTSLEARNKSYLTMEDGKPEAKAWSDRMVPKLIHAPGSANLATRIWPAI